MIYVAYNSKLEQSFLVDIFAFFTVKNSKLLKHIQQYPLKKMINYFNF